MAVDKNPIDKKDFLVEIHTEELPPKSLKRLAKAFLQEIEDRLRKAELSFGAANYFATPRRLAVLISDLTAKQADAVVDRKGPALEAAYDKEGKPSQACVGFARSCGVDVDQLIKIEMKGGTFVGYKQTVPGKSVTELMPAFVQQALAALPISKRMHWGNKAEEFVRPVHSVMMLYGNDIIDAEILGCRTGRKTRGHRFMSSGWIEIKNPNDYVSALEKNYVIADFDRRQQSIQEQTKKVNSHVHVEADLLEEVTAIVEWPVAFSGKFDSSFLAVPQEALISAMQDHQRYFPVMENGKLQAQFVAVSNIESKDPARMIAGNERVLRARLADAAFFFETDKKRSLESRGENLKNIVFQAKLGTLFDKTQRVMKLAEWIAEQVKADKTLASRAAMLSKTDLTTDLVGEFPELQGIAGSYYALHDGEKNEVAVAIQDQYKPRFSGDELPSETLGCVVAIADRLDTLVGVFGINQQPTGEKDPFGLRRAALGVLRILIEKKLNLDLRELLKFAQKNYPKLENQEAAEQVLSFMLDRLKPWYQEQQISADVFAAVSALNIAKPYDFHCRIQAVQIFKKMPEAEALSVANKRVSNILAKYDSEISAHEIDAKLFEHDAERVLAEKLQEQQNAVISLSQSAKYQEGLAQLATLRKPVDDFFDHVMVMVDDKPRRENRLLLLKKLRELFLQVADVALLQ
jgi:glycyl-tRNA synthetase beta chain